MKNHVKHTPVYQKTIVITGATSGVGRAAALELAAIGATLVLAARRDRILSELVDECENLGARAIGVVTDVTDSQAVKRLAQEANDLSGKIDVWINNAGVLAAGTFDETPVEIHQQVIATNLMGYMHGAHAVMPYFKNQGYGVLINNISVGAWLPTPYAAAYTASKFGLLGFAESLRGELIRYKDIHVCNLFPAFLDTPGLQHAANYSGKQLRPAPPVYSPQRVALAMVRLCQRPKASSTTDLAAPFLKLAYATVPSITLGMLAKTMERYFKHAAPIANTSGNVLSPVRYGSSISGGWQSSLTKEILPYLGKAALLGAGIAFAFWQSGKSRA